jgi:hypothetical protein
LLHFRAQVQGVPVVPASLVRVVPDAPPQPLSDLRAKGAWLPALHRAEDVLSAGFAKKIAKGGPATQPDDQRTEFSPAEKEFVAFVNVNPKTRLKGMLAFRLVDSSDRVVVESKPSKVSIRPGTIVMTSWTLPIPSVVGWYRADISLDGVPMYRTFVRIAE